MLASRRVKTAFAVAALATVVTASAAATAPAASAAKGVSQVRFATFNASLNRNFEGQLRSDLSTPTMPKLALSRRSSSASDPMCC